jgi:polysaccharide biosynthesis/export protein
MIKACKQASVLCLACLTTVGASLWGQQPPERTTVAPPHRTAPEKPNRSLESKSGPAPVVEPPDLLIVEVLEALPGRPLSGERLVRPDGTISLGFYGDVHVAGLTLPEIKEKVVLHMRNYLNDEVLDLIVHDDETGETVIDPSTRKPKMIDPKDCNSVFVDLTTYNSQNYYVEGDVYFPSRIHCTGNDTVLDVLHYVGGIMPSADRSQIRLVRSYPKGSPAKVLPIDYEEITMGTDSSTNYSMLPNDRLVVPRRSDDTSQTATSPRTSPPRPSRPDISYFNTTMSAGDSEDRQVTSLRALERHLNAVERKLDTLIEVMQAATKANQPKAGRVKAKISPPPVLDDAEDDPRSSEPSRPLLPSRADGPFGPHPKPSAPPDEE